MRVPKTFPVELVPIAELRRLERNPREHPPAQIAALASLMEEFGFTDAVILTEAGELLAGEGRLDAAELNGYEALPAIRLSDLTPEQRQRFTIAHNRIPELSGWNVPGLVAELRELEAAGSRPIASGFTEAELLALEQATEPPAPRMSRDDFPGADEPRDAFAPRDDIPEPAGDGDADPRAFAVTIAFEDRDQLETWKRYTRHLRKVARASRETSTASLVAADVARRLGEGDGR